MLLGVHTKKHAQRLKQLLAKEGIQVEIKPLKLEKPLVDMPVGMEVDIDDLPTALRIIENIEIFELDSDKDTIAVKPRKKATDIIMGKKPAADSSKGNIVLPVDFSDRSLAAAKIAFPVAARLQTSITLLHAYVLPSAADTFSLSPDTLAFEPADMQLDETIEETARGQMETFTENLRDYIKEGILPPVKFDIEIQEGLPETIINDYARENESRLIVMGTRGAKKKELELVGSVTAEVLDTSRCPVLTIPENATVKMGALHDVAFFCNLDNDDIVALNTLHELFPDTSFHITFYYIVSRKDKFSLVTPDDAMTKLSNYCKAKFRSFTFATKALEPREAKAMFSSETPEGVNFIVVPNKRRHALARLFNPGIAHRLLFVADLDMLVVPV